MTKFKKAILSTLAYADIFNYPLTLKEINHWLIQQSKGFRNHQRPASPNRGESAASAKDGSEPIEFLIKKNLIQKTKSYYHLKGRKSIVSLRQKRHQASLLKFKKAKKIAKLLSFITCIKLIAVTGALAMNNSDESDDIDLMIITKTNCLWGTRLLVNSLLDLFRLRRRPGQESAKDKFCVNLLLDESALFIHPSGRNLYTAHEVTQIKPLYTKDNTYEKFITANSWVNNFLPHATANVNEILPPALTVTKETFFENLAYRLQHLYMSKKLTREKVSLHYAFFHPRPTGQIVLKKHKNRLKSLGFGNSNRASSEPKKL